MKYVLLVEENDRSRSSSSSHPAGQVQIAIENSGRECLPTSSVEEALEEVRSNNCSLIVSNLSLELEDWRTLVKESRRLRPELPIVVLASDGGMERTAEAIEIGASKLYLNQDLSELGEKLELLLLNNKENQSLTGVFPKSLSRFMVSKSEAMNEVFREAGLVAGVNCPVLVCGESGTGKELLARRIHLESSRSSSPFFSINCASIPENLLESEFFGHIAGSFTGASKDRLGHFQAADKGSIFLDEIGDMPAGLQCKLLRSLQESEVRKVGSNKSEQIDVRVISATNADLKERMEDGRFRIDLYYRLAVVVINIPPLRARPEDIEPLSAHFLRKKTPSGHEVPRLSKEALSTLKAYGWPGNVRQLENVLERAMLFSKGEITSSNLCLESSSPARTSSSLHQAVAEATRKTEISMIRAALAQSEGNKTRAARELRVSYKTLLNKIKLYEL